MGREELMRAIEEIIERLESDNALRIVLRFLMKIAG
nr:MAG TPA: hypothetical protein [Caudoviricetes sp.]